MSFRCRYAKNNLFIFVIGSYYYFSILLIGTVPICQICQICQKYMVYVNGVWQNGHEKDTVRVAVSDFLATSNRNTDGMDNPLYLWRTTDRLISDDMPSTTDFIQVLEEEAAANNEHIPFPTQCEFINRAYPGN